MAAGVCVTVCAAVLLRLLLLGFGLYQDRTLRLKYTDVDYHVFTDAARFITQGASPYARVTYRYTPLVALLLTPNVLLTAAWGKLVFAGADVLTGLLTLRLLWARGASRDRALLACGAWLLNPLPAALCTRGSADSLVTSLVLATLVCVETRHVARAAVLFGLAVHTKIYPLTYALPLLLRLAPPTPGLWGHARALLRKEPLRFAALSGGVFTLLTAAFYCMYGWTFLQETYLYHVTRRDVRHNFSPYFYMLYLTAEGRGSVGVALLCFLPQLLLLLACALAFRSDLPFCCFLTSAVFVSFNKVCTSQYFLWYLCLLPPLLPRLRWGRARGAGLLLLWGVGQGAWLMPAYLLEFCGWNSFTLIWAAALMFLLINCLVLGQIISHYTPLEKSD